MSVKIYQSFIDAPTVQDDIALTKDVVGHLEEHLPDVVRAYPAGYFIGLVGHSARIARDRFVLNESAAIRLFVRLRWEIAPGYYHHPTISAALSDQKLRPIDRFEKLLEQDNGQVWLDAMEYDGEAFWRGEYSDGFDRVLLGDPSHDAAQDRQGEYTR